MRNTFVRSLIRAAEKDERIFLLTGDLGYSVIEGFRDQFPDRFLNVGVAEQNMIGVAAGLAHTGKKVFCYSIVNFAVTRCLEQIRNDVCYHGVDVTVVSVGGGVAYGSQGYTHHGSEDIAFTRSLPNMLVAAPSDPTEAEWATAAIVKRGGPAYLRLGRGGEPKLFDTPHDADQFGRLIEIAPARRVTIIGTGAVLGEALQAQRQLRDAGIEVGLYSMPVVNPPDRERLEALGHKCDVLVSVEEHLAEGGAGSVVAEIVSGLDGRRARVVRLGLSGANIKTVGDQKYLWQLNGIDAAGIYRTVEAVAGTPLSGDLVPSLAGRLK